MILRPLSPSSLALRLVLSVTLFFTHPARAETESVAVLETRAAAVHPAAASAVTRQIYATIARLGYRAVPESATAAASLGGGSPATQDLARVLAATGASRAVEATIGADHGRYAVALVAIAVRDTRPAFASQPADPATLEAVVDSLVRSLFPPPPKDAGAAAAAHPTETAKEPARSRVALGTEGAFGIAKYPFYNQLVGGRFDYGFTPDLAMGAFVGYANLKGKDGRASNVLPYLQFEYRVRFSDSWRGRMPLRFASGYLPKNGPFLRIAAGLSFPLGDSAHLGLDLVAPAVWVVKNRTAASMDVAAEVSFDL